jgi:hypothetical protein
MSYSSISIPVSVSGMVLRTVLENKKPLLKYSVVTYAYAILEKS